MAMTLRLTETEDRALTEAAARRGISKQEAVREAIRGHTSQAEELDALVRRGIERLGPVLDELEDRTRSSGA